MTAGLLIAGGLAGCGSSSSSSGSSSSPSGSSAVTTTVAGAAEAVASANLAATSKSAAATSKSAAATSNAAGTTTAPVAKLKPTKRTKAAVVELCKLSVEEQSSISAATRAGLAGRCSTAVEGATASDRKKAAEEICLGLVGITSKTPRSGREYALKQCKTNAWD